MNQYLFGYKLQNLYQKEQQDSKPSEKGEEGGGREEREGRRKVREKEKGGERGEKEGRMSIETKINTLLSGGLVLTYDC